MLFNQQTKHYAMAQVQHAVTFTGAVSGTTYAGQIIILQ